MVNRVGQNPKHKNKRNTQFFCKQFFRCVDYFYTENPQLSNSELFDQTMEQWLLGDLADIGLGCLPESVMNDTNQFNLNAKYPLQMQYILDIGKHVL